MGDVLYSRRAYVVVDEVRVEGLRLGFKAKRTSTGDPNTLDLKIYNLKAATRARLQNQAVPVVLVAGYATTAEVIFSGRSRSIDHAREGAEWVTHVMCGDGEAVLSSARSRFSFGAGVSVHDVLSRVGNDMAGISFGDALAKLRSGELGGLVTSFSGGFTAHGPSVRELSRVVNAAGLDWSVQDGSLQLVKRGSSNDESAIVLSPTTGLIGSPDHSSPKGYAPNDPAGLEKGSRLKAKALLMPGLRPNREVRFETAQRRGRYRVVEVVHDGDTHGADWHSTIEAAPL